MRKLLLYQACAIWLLAFCSGAPGGGPVCDGKLSSFAAALDRIQGDLAAIYIGDDESYRVMLPRKYLPAEAKQGSHLVITIRVDTERQNEIREKILRLQRIITER